MSTAVRDTVGPYIALDWYDGPLLEIAHVDFEGRDRMIQVCTLCTAHDDEQPPSARGEITPLERVEAVK